MAWRDLHTEFNEKIPRREANAKHLFANKEANNIFGVASARDDIYYAPMTNQKNDKKEVLRTFDMYHFFSRKDVILAIILILIILAAVLYQVFISPEVV